MSPVVVILYAAETEDNASYEEDVSFDEVPTVTCLFCTGMFVTISAALYHCKVEHVLDILKLRKKMNWVAFVKMINYIKRTRPYPRMVAESDGSLWQSDEYFPSIEEVDSWFCLDMTGSCEEDMNFEHNSSDSNGGVSTVACLFCIRSFVTIKAALYHCKVGHYLDIVGIRKKVNWVDFVKMINYIKRTRPNPRMVAESDGSLWESDEYFPSIEELDSWFCLDINESHEEDMSFEDDSSDSDEVPTVACLFCTRMFVTINTALHHCKADHNFDIFELRNKMDRITFEKMINYIKITHPDPKTVAESDGSLWESDDYLPYGEELDSWFFLEKDMEPFFSWLKFRDSPEACLVVNAENRSVTLCDHHSAEHQSTVEEKDSTNESLVSVKKTPVAALEVSEANMDVDMAQSLGSGLKQMPLRIDEVVLQQQQIQHQSQLHSPHAQVVVQQPPPGLTPLQNLATASGLVGFSQGQLIPPNVTTLQAAEYGPPPTGVSPPSQHITYYPGQQIYVTQPPLEQQVQVQTQEPQPVPLPNLSTQQQQPPHQNFFASPHGGKTVSGTYPYQYVPRSAPSIVSYPSFLRPEQQSVPQSVSQQQAHHWQHQVSQAHHSQGSPVLMNPGQAPPSHYQQAGSPVQGIPMQQVQGAPTSQQQGIVVQDTQQQIQQATTSLQHPQQQSPQSSHGIRHGQKRRSTETESSRTRRCQRTEEPAYYYINTEQEI